MSELDDLKVAATKIPGQAKLALDKVKGEPYAAPAQKLIDNYSLYVQQSADRKQTPDDIKKWVLEDQEAQKILKDLDAATKQKAMDAAIDAYDRDQNYSKVADDLKKNLGDASKATKGFFESNTGGLIGGLLAAIGLPMIMGMFGMGGEGGMSPIMSLLIGAVAFLGIGAMTNPDSVGGHLLANFTGDKSKDANAQGKSLAVAPNGPSAVQASALVASNDPNMHDLGSFATPNVPKQPVGKQNQPALHS